MSVHRYGPEQRVALWKFAACMAFTLGVVFGVLMLGAIAADAQTPSPSPSPSPTSTTTEPCTTATPVADWTWSDEPGATVECAEVVTAQTLGSIRVILTVGLGAIGFGVFALLVFTVATRR